MRCYEAGTKKAPNGRVSLGLRKKCKPTTNACASHLTVSSTHCGLTKNISRSASEGQFYCGPRQTQSDAYAS